MLEPWILIIKYWCILFGITILNSTDNSLQNPDIFRQTCNHWTAHTAAKFQVKWIWQYDPASTLSYCFAPGSWHIKPYSWRKQDPSWGQWILIRCEHALVAWSNAVRQWPRLFYEYKYPSTHPRSTRRQMRVSSQSQIYTTVRICYILTLLTVNIKCIP